MTGTFLLIHFLLSALLGIGSAVLLVEKRFDYPVRNINIPLRRLLRRWVSKKFGRVTQCAVCMSFWTTLIAEAWIVVGTGAWAMLYLPFLWPFSGLAAAGLLWLVYEAFKAVEKGQDVRVDVVLPEPKAEVQQGEDERFRLPDGVKP